MGAYNAVEGIMEIPCGEYGSVFLSQQISGDVKSAYETWLEATARKRLFKMKKVLNAAEYKESFEALRADIAASIYAWAGPAWERSLTGKPGVVKFTCLLAAEADSRMAPDKRQNLRPEKVFQISVDPTLMIETAAGLQSELFQAVEDLIMANKANFIIPPEEILDG